MKEYNNMDDMLALYALGGLTDEEILEVEAYIADHPEMAQELADFMKVVDALPFASVPIKPSQRMEALLMERVAEDAIVRFAPYASNQTDASAVERVAVTNVESRAVVAPSPPQAYSLWEWLKNLITQPAFSLAASALAIVLLLWSMSLNWQFVALDERLAAVQVQLDSVQLRNDALAADNDSLRDDNERLGDEVVALLDENGRLQNTNDSLTNQVVTLTDETAGLNNQIDTLTVNNQLLEEQLAGQQEVMDLVVASNTHTVALAGTEAQPEAGGQLVLNPDSHVALLIVSDLPPLSEGLVYQVLLIRDNGHDTADTFLVDSEGENVLIIHSAAPLSDFMAVGVSVEPSGGSPQRTGDIVILGEIGQS
ncbi:MAG: anti-sigma factor [Anaerolineales bacterium]|nr:anti-sigma factor [Anaerolineales bacterium]